MKVLVTGGSGYVGGALTDLLMNSTHEFRVYDNLTFEDDYLKPVPFVFGDVRDKKKLKEQLDWADCIIWLAALVGDAACAFNPEITKEINDDAIKFLSENFNGRIIFPSTCSVYGAQNGILIESSPTNPLSIYASMKLKAEEYLKDKALIFRLGTLFGVGDHYSRIRLDLVVNTLTAKAFNEEKITVFGGEQWRPLLHVKDAAQTMFDAIGTSTTGIFNLSHENMSISDLAKEVQNAVPCRIEFQQMKFEDSRNYKVASNLPTSRSVASGIEEVRELFEDGRIKDPLNPRYNNYGYISR